MTFEEAEKSGVEKLMNIYEKSEAENIVALLLEHITKYTRTQRLMHRRQRFSSREKAQFETSMKRLFHCEPLQYILQEAWFCGNKFYVNKHVLIPRPETEELVVWIKDCIAETSLKILDIGTGSGCIAISLKKYIPGCNVSAIDISANALETAKKNATDMDTEINFCKTNILDRKQWRCCREKFDIIVSNPPYVRETEKENMHANVLDHEPPNALFVPNEDPLIFYRKIAGFAQKHLRPKGQLFFEINEAFGKQTAELLSDNGFDEIILKKDMQGKDRMIKGTLKNNY